jgi:16S rRNA (cytidine1402-2'-O)-methyltransferase
LINQAIENGIDVVPVPGVSAIITALSVSGLPMDSFVFLGFPPHKAGQRKRFLAALADEPKTLDFFESPKRIIAFQHDMEEMWGNRKCVLARELTKVFEEVLRGSIAELLPLLEGREIKGEWTLLVSGREKSLSIPVDDVITRFHALAHDAVLSRRDIVELIAQETGLPRRKVYQQILKNDRG